MPDDSGDPVAPIIDYAHERRPSQHPLPRRLELIWRVGLISAAVPYVCPGIWLLVDRTLGSSTVGSMVVAMLIGIAVLAELTAIVLALVFMARTESLGLPEEVVAPRRRILVTILMAPFGILPALTALILVMNLVFG